MLRLYFKTFLNQKNMNGAMIRQKGYVCPVRGCPKKHNRRFTSLGITQHLLSQHPGEFQKRLKLKIDLKK